MSKYKFKIIYRNENKYGQYWGDNRYTIYIIAETLEQAKQKLDEIEKNDYEMHKNILEWGAEEITEEKDKEIERLNKEIERLNIALNGSNNIINELKNVYKNVISRCFEIGNNDLAEYLLAQLDVNTIKVEELKELKEHNMGHNTQNETQKEKV